ncbi:MAG: DUF1570 domain-containing protein [Planctomycetales bacterium]|nr:DUF1570 domain-containing protein [Planctomycetales bacterium]
MRIFASTLTLLWLCAAAVPLAVGIEHVEVQDDKGRRQLKGEIVVEAKDGGLMLRTDDGGLHLLLARHITSRRTDDEPFKLLEREELGKRILAELPPGFQIHDSTNYLICYNTTRSYAIWTSSLLERLNKAFLAFWKRKGCELEVPSQPLPVLIFSDEQSYADYAQAELGPGAASVIGYYSLTTNRIMMYDLTGLQSLRREESLRGSRRDISVLLSLPAAEPLVATIVHEATHQIAFNCGLQTRFADNPIWMSEGMAVFFETPDLSSSRSWRGIGSVNYPRWDHYCDLEADDALIPLPQLLSDDQTFRTRDTALDAYAQAWAWNYFLIKWRPKEYVAYLKEIAAKPVLIQDTPKQRLADFKRHFGDDLEALQDEFDRRMDRVK